MRKLVIIIAMSIVPGMPGCVTRGAALKYGNEMFHVGYSLGMEETALERMNWTLEKSTLRAEIDRRDEDAAERNRRSNPYTVELEFDH